MKGLEVITFGCRLNAFESAVIRDEAAAAGLTDALIVNTCAVTGEAVRQARQTIRRLKREHPDRPVIVTGCAAQLAPQHFAAMPEVARVLGNREKLDRAVLAAPENPVVVSDIMTLRETSSHLVEGFDGRSRAFVQVQQGCDHRCTFCIIPFARGPNRSVPVDHIVGQVRRLAHSGYREIVLTGVDICSYGNDLPDRATLGDVVRAVLDRVPELARLRLSTLDPAAIDDRLFAMLDHPRLMPHFHLSLQAADDLTLKRMKRRHDRAEGIDCAARLRQARPDAVLGADLIAGFPTETAAMFENTLAAVVEMEIVFAHVFPFSPRPDTPAARMPQLAPSLRRERAARLRQAIATTRARFLAQQVGTDTEILVETDTVGRSPQYVMVRFEPPAPVGSLQHVRITGTDGEGLSGVRTT